MATKEIVMVHGMWGGDWCWGAYKSFFETQGYTCHTPNLRFHDMAPQDQPNNALGTTGLLDYVEDLETFIRQFDSPPILMGHSMGGLVVQKLVARGLGSKAILLTPAPPYGIQALTWSVLRSFYRIFIQWGFWNRPYRISFTSARYAFLNLIPESVQKTEYDKLVYESGKVITQIAFWYLDPTGASRVDESKVNIPLLIIAGGKDRIVPQSVVKKVARKYKATATFKVFKDHSHYLIGEDNWEEVAQFSYDWLGSSC